VKASFTAAIVVRSLLAALGEVWVVGLVVGRLVVCGLAWGSVVVAVDIGCAESPWVWLVEGPAAETWGGSGWEKSLAGNIFGVLGSPISHRGDHGAVYQQAGFWRFEIAGREVGRLRLRDQNRHAYLARRVPRGVPRRDI